MFYILRVKDQKRWGCYNYFNLEKFDMVSELKEATCFKEQDVNGILSILNNDVHIPFEKVPVTTQMICMAMSDLNTQKDNFTWEQIEEQNRRRHIDAEFERRRNELSTEEKRLSSIMEEIENKTNDIEKEYAERKVPVIALILLSIFMCVGYAFTSIH